jgi:hypothetical protein
LRWDSQVKMTVIAIIAAQATSMLRLARIRLPCRAPEQAGRGACRAVLGVRWRSPAARAVAAGASRRAHGPISHPGVPAGRGAHRQHWRPLPAWRGARWLHPSRSWHPIQRAGRSSVAPGTRGPGPVQWLRSHVGVRSAREMRHRDHEETRWGRGPSFPPAGSLRSHFKRAGASPQTRRC